MSENISNTTENVPFAFSMWQIFHNTIVKMFKNLDNAEDNLRMLVNTLLKENEFADTLIPKYDCTLSPEENKLIEKQYEAFTVWLLGRLFYLLSCNNLEKIHHSFIEAQVKILDVLQIHQPYSHFNMIKEYNDALTVLCNFMYEKEKEDIDNKKMLLHCFIPDVTVIKKKDLDLSPELVHIENDFVCTSMQKYILEILTKTSFTLISTGFLDKTMLSIFKNMSNCLEKSKPDSKLVVINFLIKIVDRLSFQLKTSDILWNFTLNSLCYIEQLVYNYHLNLFYFNVEESENFEKALMQLFDIFCDVELISEIEIHSKFIRICTFLISQALTEKRIETNSKNNLLKTTLKLLCLILETQNNPYDNIQYLIKYTLDVRIPTFGYALLEYQIFYEIKKSLKNYINEYRNLIDAKLIVQELSSTWRTILESINLSLDFYSTRYSDLKSLLEFFNMFKNIMKICRKIYFMMQEWFLENLNIQVSSNFSFIDLTQFIIKFHQIKDNYNLNINNNSINYLDAIVTSFSYLISTIDVKEKSIEFDTIIYYMCYPFIGIVSFPSADINLSNSLKNEITGNVLLEKQIHCLKKLSVCMVNCNKYQWKHFSHCQQWIKNIFLYCLQNDTLAIEVIKNLPYLLSSWKDETIVSDILLTIMKTNNEKYLEVLMDNIGKIICQTIGEISTCRIFNDDEDDILYYNIFCNHCDIETTINKNKMLSLPKLKFKMEEIYTITTALTYFNLLNVNFRRNLSKNLPRFAYHIDKFHTEEITKKWLELMSDDDKDTKKSFTKVFAKTIKIMQNKDFINNETKKHLFKICLQSVIDRTMKNCLKLNNREQHDLTLELEFIREIGKTNGEDVVCVTVRLLIVYLIICDSNISLIALDVLHNIAKQHNITPNQIYVKYKKKYCQTIANIAVYNYSANNVNLQNSIKRVLPAFEFTTKEFLSREGHHILPYFLTSFAKLPQTQPLLNEIADLLMSDPAEILTSNYVYIFPHVALYEPLEICLKVFSIITSVTKVQEKILRKRNLQVIYNELLMHFHDKKQEVLTAVYNLSKDSSGQAVISDKNNMNEYATALNPRFLGVLVYFDSKLVSKRVCDEVKVNVLLSLPGILKLMGMKYITPLRFKVLATLRTALNLTDDPYPEYSCNVWEAFVHCCDPESLGPLLSTIFISLIPFQKKFTHKINDIFRYLLIENENKVKENIPDLFFLQETSVNKEFKNIVQKHINENPPKNFLEQLNVYLRSISNENIEVKLYTLKFLKKILIDKRLELVENVLGSNGMSETIVELIDILINGCRDSDQNLRLACGECLGELGAVEPSHFPRKYILTDSNFTFYITDDVFIVNALLELIRAFQMEKHTQNMNRYALAIQETLKEYGVSPNENSPRSHLWNEFPDNIKELMLPLLSSRYTVAVSNDKNITSHPIYGSNLGTSFKEWVYNWTSFLITLQKNNKKSLLLVCKPSLKQDYRTLMFYLPHILIHAILESDEMDRKLIYEEFMMVLTSTDNQRALDPIQLKHRPLKSQSFSTVVVEQVTEETGRNKFLKVIFILLDYLDRWLLEWESSGKSKSTTEHLSHSNTIKDFMAKFCKLMIAKCNYVREEYPRALLYLEKYIKEDKTRLNSQLSFLAKIYAELEEPDGVAGAMAIQQTEPSLEDLILSHRLTGQLQDMAACYERMAQESTLKPEYLREMIRCYLELDNPFTAFNIAQGAIEKHNDYKFMLYEAQAESYWRLSEYDELKGLLSKPELQQNKNWGVSIGRLLQHFRFGERDGFKKEISCIRNTLTEMLTITSIDEGVYRHGYAHVIKLHILNELQKAEEMVHYIKNLEDNNRCEEEINKLIEEWDLRLKTIQASVRVYEPVLRLRRIILEQSQVILKSDNVRDILDKHIAKYWLKSAEIARKAGIYQQAYMYLLKAEKYKPMELFIEKAKFYWAKEEQELAFATLKRGIEEHFPDSSNFKDMSPLIRKNDRKLCAKAKLLIATYNDETANVGIEVNISNYKEAVDTYKEWEKSLVKLAQYYDKIFSCMSDEERDIKGGEIQIHIINCFGKSLQFGSNFIYQSMPRMLSIWFDFGTRIIQTKQTDDRKVYEAKVHTVLKMVKLFDTYLDRLPAYMFLSAFSQLVSRICHPLREVYLQIKSMLIKLIIKYPQQCMWMILAVSKSGYATRTKRCQEILQDPRLKNSKVIRLIYDFNRLAEKLIELCNKPLSNNITFARINDVIRTLPRLLQNKDFSEIILPIEKLRKMILPNPDFANSEHNPFPNAFIYIAGIEDEINILASLQRPRKITFRGSDGKKYTHMLKPKDDLRKDSRLMEFNDVVNMYLHREPESRQKRLYIRTYSVVPLNEECGIIEWVDNLVGLRPILMNMYKQKGLYVSPKDLKQLICNVRDPLEKKRQLFVEKLLPKHPPILSEWFRRKFPDAHHWYQARTAYIRTSAVMSMVGYILGLGDRHGENILFDSTNGDVVHVDFNCLFNKGEGFDWPERVPFRLTHNMVEAMGPLGVEGIFRKSCAVTLRTLRIHTETLMSIVKPFVYDPLVSWPRNQPTKTDQSDAERTNEQAVEHIRNIELRLQGSYKSRGKTYSVPLSYDGQSNNLISEATNIDNLSQMYIGWGPFL